MGHYFLDTQYKYQGANCDLRSVSNSVRGTEDLTCIIPGYSAAHRLRPIDTHLALYTMLYNNSAKNKYAEPVHNKTMKIFKIRD